MFRTLAFAHLAFAGVVELTEQSLPEFVKQHERVLVKFYAPWCPYCQDMVPAYEAAAQQVENDGLHTKLAKVDATVHRQIADKHGVEGYPTLKFFFKGVAQEYDGGRDQASIVNFCKLKETNPGPSLLLKNNALRSSQTILTNPILAEDVREQQQIENDAYKSYSALANFKETMHNLLTGKAF